MKTASEKLSFASRINDSQRKFEQLEKSIQEYELNWHLHRKAPISPYLRRNPALRRKLLQKYLDRSIVQTKEVYSRRGHWEAFRSQFHFALLDRLLPPDKISWESDEPLGSVYILLGLPGSGKTTCLRPLVHRHSGLSADQIALSDADAVRIEIPEYEAGLGSGIVQAETVVLTYGSNGYPADGGLQNRATESNSATIIDIVGDANYLPEVVQSLTGRGRRVFILLAQCDESICIERAKQRALTEGRYVPLSIIQAKVGAPESAFQAALDTKELAGWVKVNTSGRQAVIVDSKNFDLAD
jgi:hypothetical protein